MNNCEYYHEYKTIKGWENSERPIYGKMGVCYGQKNAPECYYNGCPDECDLLRARNEREASKKASSKTYFDLIVNGTPEQLALYVSKIIEKSKSYPKLGDYNVILDSLNSKVKEDKEQRILLICYFTIPLYYLYFLRAEQNSI